MTQWRNEGRRIRGVRCPDCPCGCPCSAGYSGVSVSLSGQPGTNTGGALDYVDSFDVDGWKYCTWFKEWGSITDEYTADRLTIGVAFIRRPDGDKSVNILIEGVWQFPGGSVFVETWSAAPASAPSAGLGFLLNDVPCEGLARTLDVVFLQGSCGSCPSTSGYVFFTTTPL